MRHSLSWLVSPLIFFSYTRAVEWTPDISSVANSHFHTLSDEAITLDSMSSLAPAIQTLDYGRSIDGIPAFEVLRYLGIRDDVRRKQGRAGKLLVSDAPLPLAAAMDTYRVNRYNITGPGRMTNRLIQGAFRYQKLNLSSPGVLKLRGVGVTSQIDNTPPTELPGFFHSSDATLNAIWTTDARTVQMAEIPQASVPDFWDVTPEGAVIDSLAPQVLGSAVAAQLLEYNVEFKVKPIKGGFGFVVLADTLNVGVYITCDVEARLIAAHAGSTALDPLLQETALPSNLTVGLNRFHSVHAVVAMTEIAVSIDGTPVLQLSQTSRFFGSVGLGTSFGHKAVFRDLSITNPTDDTTIYYAHPLTDPSFLPDFFLGTNPAAVVVDGSRRDRIAYAGDLDIAGGASIASTHNLDALLGTLGLLGSYQAAPGFFIPTAKIQQAPLADELNVNVTGLIGYSFNFVTAVAATYMHTGDAAFARSWAPKVQKMLDWAHSQTSVESNGLLSISDPSMGGDWNYYDPPQSGIVTKFNVLYAYALQETLNSQLLADGGVAGPGGVHQTRLENLRRAIDRHLWSDDLQAYVVSESLRTAFAQDANALAILAGVNLENPHHSTEKILSTLSTGLISPNPTGLRQLPLAFSPGGPVCRGSRRLSRFVLGARPTTPGWREFVVAPLTLGVRLNSSTKAIGGGNNRESNVISVQWAFDDGANDDGGGLFRMVVEAPAGTSGTVHLPRDLLVARENSTFTVNGEVVEGGAASFHVTGGTKFELRQSYKV
ncbi:Condensin complex subunit 1 [Apiospora saccharicola]